MPALFFNLCAYHLLFPISFKKPCAVGSKLFTANSIFPLGSGTLNTWAMSPVNANNGQTFSWRDPESIPPLRLPGKHCTAPSLIQSEKISGEMFRRVLRDFQLRMCGSTLRLDWEMLLLWRGGCLGSSGEIAVSLGTPEGNEQISDRVGGCVGPLV